MCKRECRRPKSIVFKLDSESKDALLEMFPPTHANVIADGFELIYKPTCAETKDLQELYGEPFDIDVTEYSEDENCQSVVVELPKMLQRFLQRCACIPISTSSASSVYEARDLAERESWYVKRETLTGTLKPVWADAKT